MMRKGATVILLCLVLVLVSGCTMTRRIAYPPANDLFITCGENVTSYIPKGQFFHVTQAPCLPVPLLGLIGYGSADVQKVYEKRVIPQIKQMGGDALICSNVQYTPDVGFWGRLVGIGCVLGSAEMTIVNGVVVKRPSSALSEIRMLEEKEPKVIEVPKPKTTRDKQVDMDIPAF